jgi:Ras-related GTP-binding protein C/D
MAAKATENPSDGPAKGKPRLLLMGQRRYDHVLRIEMDELNSIRSGKSSISSVVFHKLPPSETLFLESTARIQKDQLP